MHWIKHLLTHIILQTLLCVPVFAQLPEGRVLYNGPDTNYVVKEMDKAIAILNRGLISDSSLDSAKIKLNYVLAISLKYGYESYARKALYHLMGIDYNQKQYLKAIGRANELITHCHFITHRSIICDALLVKGMCYQALENYDPAIENYQKVVSYSGTRLHTYYAHFNMGVVMSQIRQYEKALAYMKQARNDTSLVNPSFFSNLGFIYSNLGDHQKALAYYDSAFNIAASVHEQTSVLFRKIMFLTKIKRQREAIREFEQFVPNVNENNVTREYKGMLFFAAGELYLSVDDYKNAEAYLLKAKAFKSYLANGELRLVEDRLATLYYNLKEYKKAYDLSHEVYRAEDSLKSKEVLVKANELETRYKTAEKDKALAEHHVLIVQAEKRSNRNMMIWGSIVAALVVSLVVVLFRRQSNRKIEHLQSVIEGEEKERKRLSMELHDGVNSSLAATRSYLKALEHLFPNMANEDPFIKAKQLLQFTATEVRSIAHNLSPHNLLTKGLTSAIEEFCGNLFDKNMVVEISSGIEGSLPQQTSLYLYRIAQELLHNVFKHASATKVIVTIGVSDGELFLMVEDDGIGMNAGGDRKAGIGMENLKERISSQNGSIFIEAKKTRGTIVHVSLPLKTLDKTQ